MPDLRIGDDDAQKIWGGVEHPQAPPASPVADLQKQLQLLGFRVARTTGDDADKPGVFGFWTSMAVREFQAYARLPFVAVEGSPPGDPFAFTSHTKAAAEIYPPGLPISGVVNADTSRLLALWTSNNWRCPVVICGFKKLPAIKNRAFPHPAEASKLVAVQNAWSRHDHARDASVYCSLDYADMIAGRPAVDVIGRAYAKTTTATSAIGGLVIDGRLSDAGAAITPASFIGPPPYSDAAKSTFRVIITVAHFEVSGRFDAINGWDAQVLSLGPFQFVITAVGKKDNTAGGKRAPATGELIAFFAMLQAGSASQQGAFAGSFGALGFSSDTPWANIQPNPSQRTLVARLTMQGPNGAGRMRNEADFTPWPELAAAKEPVRQWHLFRRAALLARNSADVRLALWRFCRLRIRNLLETPWGAMPGYNWPRATKLGDVLRSELAVAVMIRLHVKSPGVFAAADNHQNVAVRQWLKQVIDEWDYAGKKNPPAQWQLRAPDGEQPLVAAMVARLAQGAVAPEMGQATIYIPSLAPSTLAECRDMIAGKVPTPFQGLQRDRSFTLDTTGL